MKKYKVIESISGDLNIHTEWMDKEDAQKLIRELQDGFGESDYWIEEHGSEDLPPGEYQSTSRRSFELGDYSEDN